MCGICGLVDFKDPLTDESILKEMTARIRHRGPDTQGHCLFPPAALGHTRLSILDLSPAGRQPMLSEDQQAALSYNGEVYNFLDLRHRLEGLGVGFHGRSDTEVVLQAYLQWGPESFAMLEGMFAFALWDNRARRLFLVRDRFGIKPLYYAPLDSGVVFGSEIKSLLASGRVAREMRWEALHEYLYYGAALGEHTFFKSVRKLEPGHMLTLDEQGSRVEPYASIFEVQPVTDNLKTAEVRVRELLEDSVKRHLISDVPVGVFLSGGIDSSAIAAFAARHSPGKVQTFSAGFDFDKGVNELPKARLVAETLGTEHHEIHIACENVPEIIEQLVRCHDEPFGDTANIPLYLLAREVKGTIKVVLQGDGGDEMFGGYHRYQRLSRARWLRLLGAAVLPFERLLPPDSAAYRGMRTVRALSNPDPSLRMALLMSQEPSGQPPERVFSSEAQEEMAATDPFERYRLFFRRWSALDPVQRMIYTDLSVILPDVYFEKVDKPTMAHGIEVRVPMVDTRLAQYVVAMPAAFKANGSHLKVALRGALRGIIPDAILDGPKIGFGVPFQHWLRKPLAGYLRSVVLDSSVNQLGLFDKPVLEQCVEDHTSGKRDFGFLLNKVLNLVLWHRFYLQENRSG
jgi:asparagine synthase (glutamine-hydrolysing)